MPKTGADSYYIWEWTAKSGDLFRLTMLPSEASTISGSFTNVTESLGSIIDIKYLYESEKYPLGMINPALEITFNLNECSTNLQTLLLDAYYNYGSYTAGNIFKLEHNATGSGYLTVFLGYQSLEDTDDDFKAGTTSIKVENCFKYALSRLKISDIDNIDSLGGGASATYVVDTMYKDDPAFYENIKYNFIPNKGEYYYLWFESLATLQTYIGTKIKEITDVTSRGWFGLMNVQIFEYLGYYKIGYGNTLATYGNIGASLTKNDIYFISNISTYDYANRALDTERSIKGHAFSVWSENYETCYDFISELMQSMLLRVRPTFSANVGYLLSNYYAKNTDLTLDLKYCEFDFQRNYEIINKASSQYIEDFVEEQSITNEIVKTNGSNIADNSMTIPMPLMNLGTLAYAYERYDDGFGLITDYFKSSYINGTSLYYIDDSDAALTTYGLAEDIGSDHRYIKVHEAYNISLDSTASKSVDDVVDFELLSDVPQPSDLSTSGNQFWCQASYVADVIKNLHSNPKQASLTGKVLMSAFQNGTDNLAFDPTIASLVITPNDIQPYLSGFYTNYIITKCTTDLISGISEFETISRNW